MGSSSTGEHRAGKKLSKSDASSRVEGQSLSNLQCIGYSSVVQYKCPSKSSSIVAPFPLLVILLFPRADQLANRIPLRINSASCGQS